MAISILLRSLLVATAVVGVFGTSDEEFGVNSHLSEQDTSSWTENFVRKHGYTIETHNVFTKDGYILTLHRIPKRGGKPVLLHHGFLGRSADFVVLGPNKALAFILADQGFDVWMANARGTTNSKLHQSLNPKLFKFWNFSWHEVGHYDIPAEIDYILDETRNTKLSYVGFSMGTTAFFVLASTRPEYNEKVDKMVALGPVAFMENVRGPVLKYVTPLLAKAPWVASSFGNTEFLPTNKFMSWAAQQFCAGNEKAQKLCKNVLFLFYGYADADINGDLIDTIFEYSPSGGSVKEFLHFGQLINAARRSPTFRQFDHGLLRNLALYGQRTPPEYQLSNIQVPIHMFVGDNDWFATKEDVQTLIKHLPTTPTVKILNRKTYNHFDFVYLSESKELVYNDVVRILKS